MLATNCLALASRSLTQADEVNLHQVSIFISSQDLLPCLDACRESAWEDCISHKCNAKVPPLSPKEKTFQTPLSRNSLLVCFW